LLNKKTMGFPINILLKEFDPFLIKNENRCG
jgi:hypothetical protein